MSTEQESNEATTATATSPPPTSPWQAIFAPQYNTYYFYNTLTQETTWINPLQQQQPEASTSSSATAAASVTETETEIGANTQIQVQNENENEQEEDAAAAAQATTTSAVSTHYAALQAAALAQGIDPLLAHLDPSLLAGPSVPGSSGGTSGMFRYLTLYFILTISLSLSLFLSSP